jgi:hypothetical protein
MTAFRLIPYPVHGALEMLTGLVTMAAPFVLGFEPAAAIVSIVVGAVLVGLALGASASEPGRGTIALSTHHAADYGIAFGLVGAAAVVGIAGDELAAATLTIIAGALLALNLTTRYSVRG